uniref:Uncharacterized protein n=1 Tax=Arundo donax TaxID=35708 RepID=A0A0A9APH5_ARUDO
MATCSSVSPSTADDGNTAAVIVASWISSRNETSSPAIRTA